MTRRSLWSALLLSLFAAACGPGEVIVTSEVDATDEESGEAATQPIEGMQVQLLPFDRDAVFDSLAEEAETPEPELPEELVAARDSLQDVQAVYREADATVVTLREQLQEINEEMEQYSQAEDRYRELFAQFNELEAEMNEAEQVRDSSFEEFTEMQSETIEDLEEAQFEIERWEEEAFADYGEVMEQKLEETGQSIQTDTTDATGRATFRPDPGEWWVHARHQGPIEELYWNIRVDVERGEPVELLLQRDNAELRDAF